MPVEATAVRKLSRWLKISSQLLVLCGCLLCNALGSHIKELFKVALYKVSSVSRQTQMCAGCSFPPHISTSWCGKFTFVCFCLQGGSFHGGETTVEGFSLTLDQVERHQAGVYQCSANNGVGPPVTIDISVHILCKYQSELVKTCQLTKIIAERWLYVPLSS